MTARMLQMSGVVADLLYEVAQVPKPGEEAIVTGFSIAPGGGFNAMVAAKRAGLMVAYGGSIGSGPFARLVRDGLNKEAIPFLRAQDLRRDQGCCTVMIDAQGERTFVASDGAEGHVNADDLAQIGYSEYNWTLLSGYTLLYPGSRQALGDWLTSDLPISNLVFDPSPVVARIPNEILKAALDRATWISANAQEAAVLTGHGDPSDAAKALAQSRPQGGGAVVRIGAAGCYLAVGSCCRIVAPYNVHAIDTNGAGDTQIGSFIARLADGDTPWQAAEYANIAAAISTTIKGPATAPERAIVLDALRKRAG